MKILSRVILFITFLSPAYLFAQTQNTNQTGAVITTTGAIQPVNTTYGTASGSSSFNISGKNFSSNVVVTAPTGFELSTDNINFSKTISIDAEATNAQLSSINFNPDILRLATPTTINGTYNYTSNVDNAVTSIQVTPIAVSAKATIKVNGIALQSGATSGPIDLRVGSNKVLLEVTAADKINSKTYSITINRAPSNNANLSGLTISAGTLSPAFSPNTLNYNSTINTSIQNITIIPTAAGVGASITVNGSAVQSGMSSNILTLTRGVNNIVVRVNAEDGKTVQTYNLTVTNIPSSNAGLSQIGLTPNLFFIKTDSPTEYLSTVDQYATNVQVIAAKSDVNAITRVNGVVLPSGTTSTPVILNSVGATIILVNITAQDGITSQTFKITVNRDSPSNTEISQLATPPYSVAHVPNTNNFTVSVPPSVTTIQQLITVVNPNAKIKMNGLDLTSGKLSPPIPLNTTGTTILRNVITAPNGINTKTYTLTVSRTGSSNADLSQITLTPSAILTKQIGGFEYSTSVSPLVTSVQQTVLTSEPNATITVNGTTVSRGVASEPIQLNATGTTIIKTVITAQDGVTSKTYTLSIVRKGSTNAALSSLISLPNSTFTAIPNTTNYVTSVNPSTTTFKLGVTTADDNATIKINGTPVNNITLSDPIPLLDSGPTNVNVTITAQDGSTSLTYNVIINKNGSTNTGLAKLQLTPEATLTPIPGTNSFTTSVNAAINSVQQIATAEDAGATIKVNGVTVTSGVPSKTIPLNTNGATTINTVVTAPNGSATKSYSVIVYKKGSSNTAISEISLTPSGTLIKLPNSENYTTSLNSSVTSVQLMVKPVDAGASIKIEGKPLLAGATSQAIQLDANDVSIINVEITAQDGVSKRTFTVSITRGSNSEILSPPTSDLSPTAIFARLQANIDAGNYLDNILITSSGVKDVSMSTGIWKVSPALLKVSANNVSKIYGVILPNLVSSNAFTVNGLKNGEILNSIGLSYGKGAGATDVVGIYTGTVLPTAPYAGTNGFKEGNYEVSPVVADINITPAPLTITAKKVTKTYGESVSNVANSTAFAASGLKNGNTINSVDISYTSGITPTSPVGNYINSVVPLNAIGGGGFANSNYKISYVKGDLTILPCLLTITANNQTREFDSADPVFTVTYKGFVNGEGPAVLATAPIITTTAVLRSPIGQYPITPGNAAAANYTFNYLPGTLTVTGAHIVLGVPNVITPNGDGINDSWHIKNLDAFPHVAITIFDRLGHRIFNSVGYGMPWDGTLNGTTLQPGTYYYIIDPKEPKERARVVTGSVTLVR